jgi:cytochrome c biogenesis protein CcmG/thiol:disulfide interchange protein DsbE
VAALAWIARAYRSRAVRALAVAAAVAAWPACRAEHADPSDVPPAAAAEKARLDFTLKDMAGKTVDLRTFEGRPLIINFWATWCGPCKVEIPAFVEIADRYRDQGLTILGVSTDDAPEDLKPFAAEYKMNYPVLVGLGQDALIEAYGAVFAIPVTWFIKSDGTVLSKALGPRTKAWFDEQARLLVAGDQP